MRRQVKASTRIDRRRDIRRSNPPVKATLEAVDYQLIDLSLGGLQLANYRGNLRAGQCGWVKLSLTKRGKALTVQAEIEVLRVEPVSRRMAARFCDFEGDGFEQLQNMLINRV